MSRILGFSVCPQESRIVTTQTVKALGECTGAQWEVWVLRGQGLGRILRMALQLDALRAETRSTADLKRS